MVPMEQMFGGLKPDPLNQDRVTGANQIESATALIFSASYLKMEDDFDRKEIDELLEDL